MTTSLPPNPFTPRGTNASPVSPSPNPSPSPSNSHSAPLKLPGKALGRSSGSRGMDTSLGTGAAAFHGVPLLCGKLSRRFSLTGLLPWSHSNKVGIARAKHWPWQRVVEERWAPRRQHTSQPRYASRPRCCPKGLAVDAIRSR
jgi:hypothetical protein